MKKKIIIGSLMAVLMLVMLATIPVAVGMQYDTETEESLGLFSETTVNGFILGSSTAGFKTSFFALFVKYSISNLFGEEESGVLVLQRVTFFGKFTGNIGDFYISGSFRGTPQTG